MSRSGSNRTMGSTSKKRAFASVRSIIRCKFVRGHHWEEYIPYGMTKSRWKGMIAYVCVSCTTERYDTLDDVGDVVHREYVYPGNYRDVVWQRGAARLLVLKEQWKHRETMPAPKPIEVDGDGEGEGDKG